MEPIIRSSPVVRHMGHGNGEDNASEVEVFSSCINEISSKVNELEQRVTAVEQFYMTNNKQLNNAKCCSILKDKVKEKHWMSIEKQQQGASQKEAAAEKRMQELMRQFAVIFRQITQHKWAGPFMEPVDVVGLGLHDYYEVIDNPMDFRTIKNRMEAKDGTGYKNVREIYADVRLVFKNAMKYNDERNDVHVMAQTLLKKFEEKWLQLLPKVVEEEKRLEEEGAAAQVATKLAQEASHANMARDLSNELYEVDMQLEKLREMVVQKCRKMSYEDKKKLQTALTQLPYEDLLRAVEIVAENNPSFQATAQEVDLDINAQSELTLWRLKVFVQDALKVMGRNSGGMGMDGHNNNCNVENKDNININNKNKNTMLMTTTTATNNNITSTNNKRRREICDALTKTSIKRTKKISLNSLVS